MATTVVFYITGHGYGHSVRTAEVIRALARGESAWRIVVRTAAPRWLFEEAGAGVEIFDAHIESQVLESADSLRIDGAATAERLVDFLSSAETVVDREAAWLRDHQVSAIVADIPYLAGTIAERARIPCLGMSNFLWDFIYEPLLAGHPRADECLREIRAGYGRMQAILRFPFSHAMPVFRRIIDVPLVAPRAERSRAETTRALGIDPTDSRPVVYLGMRAGVPFETLGRAAAQSPEDIFVYVGHPRPGLPENTRNVVLGPVLSFADMVAAADTVISKPGYGMVATCAAHGTSLLYPPRTGFREDECLLRDLPRFSRVGELCLSDFASGNWQVPLRQLRSQPPPSESAPTGGAECCAENLAALVADL
ncbi:MAG: hypothetical protein QOE70_3704 [Chthoniobacter sp.]|jgi:L-arabinokinase|nr:hypothetical protein [Chthoniobacter sp.]